MKALSIKQPWAWLICAGYKDIENRDWFIGRKVASGAVNFTISLPMRVYVHTGKTFDYDGFNAVCEWIGKGLVNPVNPDEWAKLAVYPTLGAVIGEVDIVDCVMKSASPWFVGKYGFVLSNPVEYDKPIPCKGKLGFFEPDIQPAKPANHRSGE